MCQYVSVAHSNSSQLRQLRPLGQFPTWCPFGCISPHSPWDDTFSTGCHHYAEPKRLVLHGISIKWRTGILDLWGIRAATRTWPTESRMPTTSYGRLGLKYWPIPTVAATIMAPQRTEQRSSASMRSAVELSRPGLSWCAEWSSMSMSLLYNII